MSVTPREDSSRFEWFTAKYLFVTGVNAIDEHEVGLFSQPGEQRVLRKGSNGSVFSVTTIPEVFKSSILSSISPHLIIFYLRARHDIEMCKCFLV